MVRMGKYEFKLVRADDKTPFMEHVHPRTGEHYIEVEPDVDYYVRAVSDDSKFSIAQISVDGSSLGYQSLRNHSTKEESLCSGVWSVKDGVESMKALHFHRTMTYVPEYLAATGSDRPQMWTGEVEVVFYDAVNPRIKSRLENFESTWNSKGNVGATVGESKISEKKGVQSAVGRDSCQEKTLSRVVSSYSRGQELCRLKAKYCCTPGLIANGILQPYGGDRDDDDDDGDDDAEDNGVGRRKRHKTTGDRPIDLV